MIQRIKIAGKWLFHEIEFITDFFSCILGLFGLKYNCLRSLIAAWLIRRGLKVHKNVLLVCFQILKVFPSLVFPIIGDFLGNIFLIRLVNKLPVCGCK